MNGLVPCFVFFLNIIAILETRNYVNAKKINATFLSSNDDNNNNNYALTWSNGSVIRLNSSLRVTSENDTVDCFGLGTRFARILQWLYGGSDDNVASAEDVRFFYSSRKQTRRVSLMTGIQFGLEWTDFNIERRTVLIVHGFLSDSGQSWVTRMEQAFLTWASILHFIFIGSDGAYSVHPDWATPKYAQDDVNVVVVDWSARGNSFNYVKAAVNTRTVGNEIARLLHHIVNATMAAAATAYEPKWGNLHLIGHSLGAHICGFAASELKKRQEKWNVSRITGLDPANRCFGNVAASLRLNTDDASFVDVIHTNGISNDLFAFGSPQSIGHVDFYPNGGKRQPGCLLSKGLFHDVIQAPKKMLAQAICSHGYSYLYFIDSLISATTGNCTFWAHRWDRSYRRALQIISEPCDANNCTEMGIMAEKHSHRGTFFVVTSAASPFCITDTESKEQLRRQLMIDYANEILD